MSKTTISDTRVRVKPSKKLLEIIDTYKSEITEIPGNIARVLKANGISLPSKIETFTNCFAAQTPSINLNLLRSLSKEAEKDKNLAENFDTGNCGIIQDSEDLKNNGSKDEFLYFDDLRWLNQFLSNLRKNEKLDLYLYELLETSTVLLPDNEIIERDPELEARCEKLRQEQQNREYLKMTKNVDSVLKNYPEDTIAYQMKALNKQVIAVFQFVLSVVAGFAFGFLGLELIIGGLDFGLRLLMGIMCALIIALAEIYFLAKKLNEYDDIVSPSPNVLSQTPTKSRKVHSD